MDDPHVAAAERLIELAREHGFTFTPAGEHGSQWGERVTPQWVDVVFLDVSGPCNAVRSRRGHVVPGEPLFADRVSGPALTVLNTVVHGWEPLGESVSSDRPREDGGLVSRLTEVSRNLETINQNLDDLLQQATELQRAEGLQASKLRSVGYRLVSLAGDLTTLGVDAARWADDLDDANRRG